MICQNIMYLKEAPEEAPGPVFLPVAAVTGRLDLHGHGLPRGLHPTLHPGQVQPLRVGQPPPLQRRGRGARQRVLSLQLDVVHHRQPHAAGQRHLPQVRSLVGKLFTLFVAGDLSHPRPGPTINNQSPGPLMEHGSNISLGRTQSGVVM